MRAGLLAVLVAICCLPALGQEPNREIIPRPSAAFDPVVNMPYSGEMRQTRFQVLEDGTKLSEARPVSKVYRDAKGNLRIERALVDSYDPPESPRIVQLDDAEANVRYVLEPQRKIAHRFSFERRNAAASATRDSFETTAEQLGAWVIQGLHAEGVRRTTTLKPGVTIVRETWTVPDLQVVVLEKVKDPRYGEATTELLNIRMGAADSNLFRVPPDYKVADESDSFAIAFTPRWRSTPPVVLSKVTAKFTQEALRNHIRGTVGLAMVVDENGQAQDVRVEQPLDPGLDHEAIKAVKQWQFRPAQRDGHPVRMKVQVDIVFSVDN